MALTGKEKNKRRKSKKALAWQEDCRLKRLMVEYHDEERLKEEARRRDWDGVLIGLLY